MPDRTPRPAPHHFDQARLDVADEERDRSTPLDDVERQALIDERAHELAAADRDEADARFSR